MATKPTAPTTAATPSTAPATTAPSSDAGNFNNFFNDRDFVTQTFAPLAKFFSDVKRDDAAKANESMNANESRTPNGSSQNSLGNELILTSLDAIEDRLKTQSIVLVSSLEQQTKTVQLLERMTATRSEGGSAGGGHGGGGNGGGWLSTALHAAEDYLGVKALGSFLKSSGTKVMGGAAEGAAAGLAGAAEGAAEGAGGAGLGTLAAGAAAALATGAINAKVSQDVTRMAKEQKDQEDAGAYVGNILGKVGSGNPVKVADNSAKIKDLQDSLDRIQQHLKLNAETDEEKLRLAKEELAIELKIRDLRREETDSGPHGVTGAFGVAGKSGPHPAVGPNTNPADVPTAVSTPESLEVPIKNGDATAPSSATSGPSALEMLRQGIIGHDSDGKPIYAHSAGSGSSVGAARASGSLAKHQKLAYDQLIKDGVPDDAARVIVGGLSGESLRNPADVHNDPSRTNPAQMAHGIASWDDTRWAEIGGGKAAGDVSVEDQTHALVEEMKKKYPKVWADMNNPKLSQEEKMRSYIGGFEKPRDVEGQTNVRMGYVKGFHPEQANAKPDDSSSQNNNGSAGAFSPPKDAAQLGDYLNTLKSKGLLTDEQCVTLAMSSVGLRKGGPGDGTNVHQWTKGENAMAGNLVRGQPIATFLNADGSQSDKYAGGTGGRPKMGLDHAAIFERYGVENGKKGMYVDEQYQGSHGIHQKFYADDGSFGEHNARNYFAVHDSKGLPLGRANNPAYSPPVQTATATLHDRPAYQAMKDSLPSKDSNFVKDANKADQQQAKATAQRDAAMNVIVNNHGGMGSGITGHEHSNNANREVGSPNPPPQRIAELFTTQVGAKVWT
jgi:hypothetical protein